MPSKARVGKVALGLRREALPVAGRRRPSGNLLHDVHALERIKIGAHPPFVDHAERILLGAEHIVDYRLVRSSLSQVPSKRGCEPAGDIRIEAERGNAHAKCRRNVLTGNKLRRIDFHVDSLRPAASTGSFDKPQRITLGNTRCEFTSKQTLETDLSG